MGNNRTKEVTSTKKYSLHFAKDTFPGNSHWKSDWKREAILKCFWKLPLFIFFKAHPSFLLGLSGWQQLLFHTWVKDHKNIWFLLNVELKANAEISKLWSFGFTVGCDSDCLRMTWSLCLAIVHPPAKCSRLAKWPDHSCRLEARRPSRSWWASSLTSCVATQREEDQVFSLNWYEDNNYKAFLGITLVWKILSILMTKEQVSFLSPAYKLASNVGLSW